MGNKTKVIFATFSILAIIILFIIVRAGSVKKTSLKSIDSITSNNSYTLFYKGKDNKLLSNNEVKRIKKTYGVEFYVLEDNYDDVLTYLKNLSYNDNLTGDLYILYNKNSYMGYMDEQRDKDEYLKKYLMNYIPVSERKYKTITPSEYGKLFVSNDTIVTVFGESTCSYCKQLEKVINNIVPQVKQDIYYFDFNELTEDQVNDLYDIDLTIPGECTASGSDIRLIEGYSKPTTIVSKKGKVLGCIKGYYDEKTYLSKLSKLLEG